GSPAAAAVERAPAASLAPVVEPERRRALGRETGRPPDEEPRRVGLELDGVRIGPAVHVEEVEPAVVVEIGEGAAPAPESLPDADGIGRVLERAVAAAAVEPVPGRAPLTLRDALRPPHP